MDMQSNDASPDDLLPCVRRLQERASTAAVQLMPTRDLVPEALAGSDRGRVGQLALRAHTPTYESNR
jgi:hypothetical protein